MVLRLCWSAGLCGLFLLSLNGCSGADPAVSGAVSEAPAVSVEPTNVPARLQALADAAVAAGLPGVSMTFQQGIEQWTSVAGTQGGAGTLITADTLFPVASVGKPWWRRYVCAWWKTDDWP